MVHILLNDFIDFPAIRDYGPFISGTKESASGSLREQVSDFLSKFFCLGSRDKVQLLKDLLISTLRSKDVKIDPTFHRQQPEAKLLVFDVTLLG